MGLPDFVGLCGAFFYLLAYALLQLRKLDVSDWRYTAMNITGGVLLIASLFWSFNLGSLVSQVAWLIFTVVGFLRNRATRAPKSLGVNAAMKAGV